jgi:hypothetical protein
MLAAEITMLQASTGEIPRKERTVGDEKAEVTTKTDFMGNPAKDSTGAAIKEVTDADGSKAEVATKTDFSGNPAKDSTGAEIKEVKPATS